MTANQRIKIANEKAQKNITMRGNVPKSTVSNIQKIRKHPEVISTHFPNICTVVEITEKKVLR